MADRRYTIALRGKELRVDSDELARFAKRFGTGDDVNSRISELFWADAFVYWQEFGINPFTITSEIRALEQGETGRRGTKPASEFKKEPLRGLWHKHFFSAHFVIRNIREGWNGGRLDAIVNDVFDSAKSPIVTEEMIRELVHRAVHGTMEKRDNLKRITGEWIVFAKHDNQNYYLALNTHHAGDQFIADRILEHCSRQFPFLAWLAKRHPA